MKKFFLATLGIVIFLSQFAFVNAFSLGSVELFPNAQPGNSYQVDVKLIPKGPEIGQNLTYAIDIGGVKFAEDGTKQILATEATINEPYYSAAKWVNEQHQEINLNDEKGVTFNVGFRVPDDANPGTYYFNIAGQVGERNPEETGGSTVGMAAIINQLITITIPGDIDENMELVSFDLNQEKYKKGNIEFITQFKNDSVVALMPTGTIKIFDNKGEQVLGVILQTEILPDGSKVLIEKQDELRFNTSILSVEPTNTKVIPTTWENRSILPGKYEAKLEGYFGQEGKFESSVDFEIVKGVTISSFGADSAWYGNLPANFSAVISNNGSTVISPKGTLEIKDFWGNIVLSSPIKQFFIGAGEQFNLTNLVWESGFAIGTYKATLTIMDEDAGITVIEATTFAVASWWQALIIFVLLVLVILLVVKGIKKYSKMKKKLHDLEEKEDSSSEESEE